MEPRRWDGDLDVDVGAFGVAFDEAFAGADFVAHEHVEDFVGFHSFIDIDFQDGAFGGVHGGVPEGFGVHFTKTFITTNLRLFAVVGGFVFVDDGVALLFGVDEMDLLAHFDVVERGLRDVEMFFVDELLHVPEEEGEQQGTDVGAVNVGVAHDDDAAIAQFGHVEVLVDAYADGGNDVFDLFVFENFVESDAFDVEDFTAQGQYCLEMPVTPLFRTSACGIAFDQVEFAAVGAFLTTVGEFAGEGGVEHVFALDEVAGGTGGLASTS